MGILLNALGDVLGRLIPVAVLRRPWQRREIHADIELLKALKEAEGLGVGDGAAFWITNRILIDTAKLAGVPVEGTRLPVKWGSVWVSLAIGAPLGFWTYTIVRDGFNWLALLPGIPAWIFLMASVGLIVNPGTREPAKPEGSPT